VLVTGLTLRNFRSYSTAEVRLGPGITVVEFAMAVSFSDRTTGTAVAARPSRYRARLKREGPTLVLLSLTDVSAPR
jgi:hypothetical protein